MVLREAVIARAVPVLAALAALAGLPAVAAAQVDRFAVVVGNDLGQAPDLPLHWAETDAARLADVLQEVGGVRPENLVLLRGKDAAAVRRALITVNERIRESSRQTVLVVYYSGHADATGLHLGSTTLDLPELEQLVRGSPAGFRLLVLDACRSGALTRVKGGTPIPPFELRVSEKLPGEGAVFLASSSASEDSQESDELKGSFFTHALLSGLLGAADANGDGVVTLEEAYRHAYEATVRSSSRTLAGLQHPTFRYDVRGQGDVVLATLGQDDNSRGWVEFPAARTWLVLKGSSGGPVVGEIGREDRVRRLSLRPGTYFVRGRGAAELLEGTVTAAPGATLVVEPGALERTTYARLVRKGGGELRTSAYALEVEGRFRTALASEGAPCPGLATGATMALRPVSLQARLAYCQTRFTKVLETTATAVDFELGASRAWDWRRTTFELGLVAGAAYLRQDFRTVGRAPPLESVGFQLAPVAQVSRDLGDRLYAYLSVAGATYVYPVTHYENHTTRLEPSFTLRVALGMGTRL
jgi:hypothetical protein